MADEQGVPGPVEPVSITAEVAWREALALIENDLPFHAHEMFEQRWRCCPGNERDAWRLCARWAAALTHAARGNRTGARSIAQQCRETLQVMSTVPHPIDRDAVARSLARILDEDEGDGRSAVGSSPS